MFVYLNIFFLFRFDATLITTFLLFPLLFNNNNNNNDNNDNNYNYYISFFFSIEKSMIKKCPASSDEDLHQIRTDRDLVS